MADSVDVYCFVLFRCQIKIIRQVEAQDRRKMAAKHVQQAHMLVLINFLLIFSFFFFTDKFYFPLAVLTLKQSSLVLCESNFRVVHSTQVALSARGMQWNFTNSLKTTTSQGPQECVNSSNIQATDGMNIGSSLKRYALRVK